MKVNSWSHWQPLKQVVLGNVFPPEFFEDVKDTKLRDSLQKVIYETKEDLDGIKKTLEDLGVEVIQVDDCWTDSLGLNPYKTFGEFLEKSKEFYSQFPEYDGSLILDGGIKDSDLDEYEDLGVDVVVQCGAIFG